MSMFTLMNISIQLVQLFKTYLATSEPVLVPNSEIKSRRNSRSSFSVTGMRSTVSLLQRASKS